MLIAGIALALTLAQAQAPAGHGRRRRPTKPSPVQRGGRLSINNFAGEVIIHTWDKDSVRVVARHQSRTKVSIRPTSGGTVDQRERHAWVRRDRSTTTSPRRRGCRSRSKGTYNFVTMDGVQGEVYANTVRGDIVIKGGTGIITAKSVEGEVQVEGARGKVNVSSVNETDHGSPTRAARSWPSRSTAASR